MAPSRSARSGPMCVTRRPAFWSTARRSSRRGCVGLCPDSALSLCGIEAQQAYSSTPFAPPRSASTLSPSFNTSRHPLSASPHARCRHPMTNCHALLLREWHPRALWPKMRARTRPRHCELTQPLHPWPGSNSICAVQPTVWKDAVVFSAFALNTYDNIGHLRCTNGSSFDLRKGGHNKRASSEEEGAHTRHLACAETRRKHASRETCTVMHDSMRARTMLETPRKGRKIRWTLWSPNGTPCGKRRRLRRRRRRRQRQLL